MWYYIAMMNTAVKRLKSCRLPSARLPSIAIRLTPLPPPPPPARKKANRGDDRAGYVRFAGQCRPETLWVQACLNLRSRVFAQALF